MLREIAAFVGDAPQHDDMTMILLKVDERCAAATVEVARSMSRHAVRGLTRTSGCAELVVIFRTHSDIEASIVRGLLEAHGMLSVVSSDVPHRSFR